VHSSNVKQSRKQVTGLKRVRPKGHGLGPVQDLERFDRTGPMSTIYKTQIRVPISLYQKYSYSFGLNGASFLFLFLCSFQHFFLLKNVSNSK
jgi:hypothetical protein